MGIKTYFLLILAMLMSTPLLAQTPANDEPETAIILSTVTDWCSDTTSYTNAGATLNTAVPGTLSWESADVWFKFQAQKKKVTL